MQNETKAAVKEALEKFRQWNSLWLPKHVMTDFSEVEIAAVEEVFPGK